MQNSKFQFTFRQKTCSKQAIQKFRFFPFTFNFSLLTFHFWRSQTGQSLVEILIAIGLAGILLPALLTGLVSSREGKAQEGQRLAAVALVREAEEAVRSIREKGWSNISNNGTYDVAIFGSEWTLKACPCSPVNGFNRQVVISDVQRGAGGELVQIGGTNDPSTKKMVSTVSWSNPFASSVESTSYYQRYLGNAAWTQTTEADFNSGTHNNTTTVATGGGAAELTQSVGGGADYGNKFRLTATSSIGNMDSAGDKTSLRFTAQNSKIPNAIRVYLQSEVGTSPTYRYGIQASSGSNPSGAWLCSNTLVATSAGWKTIPITGCPQLSAGSVYHIVSEYASGTISTSRYVALRRSAPLNSLYPYNNAADSNANTLFNTGSGWGTAQDFQPVYELDFLDSTYEGNPYESSTEISVFGGNWYGERFSFTGADKTAQSISFYLRRNGTPASNLDVQIRRVADNGIVYSGTLATPTLSTTYVLQTHTFSPSPITLSAGTAYRVIIQTSGGSSTNSYRFHRLDTTNAANYNSITYDGTNSVYSASTNSGSSWTDTNNWDIGGFYFTVQGTSTYPANGQFTSQSSPNFGNVAFNYLTWSAATPGPTTVKLQLSVDGGATYFGSDGVSGSFFTAPAAIPLNRINGTTIIFKATLSGNGTQTPTLNDVSINYSP